MSSVAEYVAFFAPGYAADPRITIASEIASVRLGPVAWGALYTQGLALLVCHLLTLADRSVALAGGAGAGSGGVVTSISEGQASIGFGDGAGLSGASLSDAALSTTSFGLDFSALRATLADGSALWVR